MTSDVFNVHEADVHDKETCPRLDPNDDSPFTTSNIRSLLNPTPSTTSKIKNSL